MQEERSNTKQQLDFLSRSLGLPYEPQDWGIINADGRRLSEFISYYESNPLSSVQKFELAGLIMASANECLLAHESLPETFPAFLHLNVSVLQDQLDYWGNLENGLEFPLANWIRANI